MSDKKQQKFVSGKWLIVLTIVLVAIGFLIFSCRPFSISGSVALGVLAMLSGFIYSFTNANDQRVLSKRFVIVDGKTIYHEEETSGFLEPKNFVVLAGIIGAVFTWILLPTIYVGFSFSFGRSVLNFADDLGKAASLCTFGVPSFVWLGIISIVGTLAYLVVVRVSLLSLVFPTISITTITVLLGNSLYGDGVADPEFLVPLVVVSFMVFVLSRNATMMREFPNAYRNAEQKHTSRTIALTWLAIGAFVAAEVARNLLLRNTLISLPNPDKFFVALCMRAMYFSMFFLCPFVLVSAKRNSGKSRTQWIAGVFPRLTRNQMRVVLITSVTFVSAFALSTPTFAYNLALSPFLFAVAQIMAYPLLEAWYRTGGTKLNLFGRLLQTFGMMKGASIRARILSNLCIILYASSWLLCIAWVIARL